mmetsp:Transcript_13195/g.39896  ORF Transcript_13195/g.39896 Transcript_13195/m.39896 type:complete len:314 (-) Transcript_13195:59-1000(-)
MAVDEDTEIVFGNVCGIANSSALPVFAEGFEADGEEGSRIDHVVDDVLVMGEVVAGAGADGGGVVVFCLVHFLHGAREEAVRCVGFAEEEHARVEPAEGIMESADFSGGHELRDYCQHEVDARPYRKLRENFGDEVLAVRRGVGPHVRVDHHDDVEGRAAVQKKLDALDLYETALRLQGAIHCWGIDGAAHVRQAALEHLDAHVLSRFIERFVQALHRVVRLVQTLLADREHHEPERPRLPYGTVVSQNQVCVLLRIAGPLLQLRRASQVIFHVDPLHLQALACAHRQSDYEKLQHARHRLQSSTRWAAHSRT